ncbi:MAG: (2Fe-2S) ferredoxin domain-containing protein [Desulfobacteraceae bacterium]|jgi:NADP-reducing hydrogenase subunit HndB
MSKLNRTQFRNLRDELKTSKEKTTEIIVGLGSCGIAAGAGKTFDAFRKEIKAKNLTGTVLCRTGCMGFCESEPTVEIRVPGMSDIVYGGVTPEIAREIVERHVMRKRLIGNLIQDKPSGDILKEGE